MKPARRFHAMDCWLQMIVAWCRTVDLARRCNVPLGIMESVVQGFPAYPED